MVAATYLTIWMALVLFVLAEIGRAKGARHARALSGAGLGLALVHTLLAFDAFHGWSHADAVRKTAQQTEDVFGVPVGAGVYVNYLFFAVWLVDVVLWRPAVPASAGLWVTRAFYLLIVFNGAIVFAAGWRRVLGTLLVVTLVATWARPGARSQKATRYDKPKVLGWFVR